MVLMPLLDCSSLIIYNEYFTHMFKVVFNYLDLKTITLFNRFTHIIYLDNYYEFIKISCLNTAKSENK